MSKTTKNIVGPKKPGKYYPYVKIQITPEQHRELQEISQKTGISIPNIVKSRLFLSEKK